MFDMHGHANEEIGAKQWPNKRDDAEAHTPCVVWMPCKADGEIDDMDGGGTLNSDILSSFLGRSVGKRPRKQKFGV